MWHAKGRILCHHPFQHTYEIIGPHSPTHYPTNYNHTLNNSHEEPRQHVQSGDALSSITTQIYPSCRTTWKHATKDGPVWSQVGYYGHFLKQAIPGNANIASVGALDAAISKFTWTASSAESASEIFHTNPAHLEELKRRIRAARKNMHLLKLYTPPLEPEQCSTALDTTIANTINSVWKIMKQFSTHQTRRQGRKKFN